MKICLIPTSFAEHLAKNIRKKAADFEIIFPELNKDRKRHFPDGEIYMRILKARRLKNKRVLVFHSGAPKPNEGLTELELILQILRDNEVRPEVFFSYFPYGMQDKVFKKGETNVAENLIEKLNNYYRVKKIYVIDAHFWGKGRKWIKKYPIIHISAFNLLKRKVQKDFKEEVLFLAPDVGAQKRFGIQGFNKTRINSYRVEVKTPKKLKKIIKGRIVGIVDDVIKTSGTLLKVYDECKKYGAREVIALITHGAMKYGILKAKEKYSQLYLTNTIKRKGANVDITDLILSTIKKHGR